MKCGQEEIELNDSFGTVGWMAAQRRIAPLRRSTLNLPFLKRKLSRNPRMPPFTVVCHGARESSRGISPLKLREIMGNSNETSDGFEHPGTRDVQSRN